MTVSQPSSSVVCAPCAVGTPALRGTDLATRHATLGAAWQLVGEHHLEREFRFRNFREALAFTNRIGELAEAYGHHPDIHLSWGSVRLVLWTHKSDGLTESDFVLAAATDRLV